MLIRDLKSEDFDAWLPLYQIYADHYQVSLSDQGLAVTWGWLSDKTHPLTGLVAEHDGRLVGLAHYRAMPSPLRGENIGFLDDLVVLPEAKGGGVADALLAKLRLIANQQGWPVIRWITRDNNYRARAVYDRIANKTDWNMYEMAGDETSRK